MNFPSEKRTDDEENRPMVYVKQNMETGDEEKPEGSEAQSDSWRFRNRRKWLMNSLILMIVLSLVGMI